MINKLKKIRKVINSNIIPYIILFTIMFIITSLKQNVRDDLIFQNFSTIFEQPRILYFVRWRFFRWTSRVIIEILTVLIVRDFRWMWKFVDPIIYVILAYSIFRVFTNKNKSNKTMISIIVSLILIIPQIYLGEAGWVATTLVYLWPTALAIMCLIPIKKCIEGEKIKWFEIPVYLGALIFAVNSEQVAAIMFTVYAIFTVYLAIKHKLNPLIVIMLLLSLASMIFILLCPGNAARSVSEIKMHFLDYPMLNIIDKIFIGLYILVQHFVNEFNSIYVLFTVFIAISIFKKYHNIFYRIISIFPVFMGVAFNGIGEIIAKKTLGNLHYIVKGYFSTHDTILINYENFDIISAYFPVVLAIITIGCLVASIYLIFKEQKSELLIALLVFGAGICSKFILVFSTTVFCSGNRTEFIFIITMIILITMILDKYESKNLNKVFNVLAIYSLIMLLENISLCLNYTGE